MIEVYCRYDPDVANAPGALRSDSGASARDDSRFETIPSYERLDKRARSRDPLRLKAPNRTVAPSPASGK